MSQTLYVDPGHRIPDDEWGAVVRRAEEIAREAAANKTGGASPIAAPVLDMRGRSNKHSGVSGIATQLLVLHSAECPLRGGYAQSLTEWAITSTVVASWHRFVDPIARVYMMDDSVAAWHASEANPMSIGWEQAGYARYTRAEWMTPDGLLQLNSLAYDMAQVALRDGIPPVWLTTDQVTAITTHGDRATKGFCLHRQIDPETRTDPGDNYPYDLLMTRIREFMGLTIAPAGATETTPKEWDEMATPEQIFDAVWGGPGTPMIHNNELGRGEYPRTTLGAMTDRIIRQQIVPLRQEVAAQNAQIANLISALANVSKGEAFDEAKLLAGVKSAAEEGVKNAIESIDTTVTISQENTK